MHHETNNPNDVLVYTIELCPPCHGETLRKADSKEVVFKIIKVSPDVMKP